MKRIIFPVIVVAAAAAYFLWFKQKKAGKGANDKQLTVFCAPSFDPALMNTGNAPMFEGLGKIHFAVTTKSDKAQQYFDQGLALLYGFNHGEAGRSFKAAIEHDSSLAMAYWGLGMVLGPNYNAALNPSSLTDINDAMEKAVRFSVYASEKERVLINALAKRFPKEETTDMSSYNAAYTAAMRMAHEQFSGDPEIAVLYADALMNEHPWDLWLKDGTAEPWTALIIETLEKILAKWSDHPSAIHLYIHATEASGTPEKALLHADKLASIMPAVGHIVHMPSHTYIRTGDYHKGVVVNEKASEVDSTYIAQCKIQGSVPIMYYPHNIHFLAMCAFLEGSSKKAIDAAWMINRKADRKVIGENVTVQHYYCIPFYVLVQLGKWNDILQLQKPDESLKYPVAVWHYARGMAFAATGKADEGKKELNALRKIAKDKTLESMRIWETNSAAQLTDIAASVLDAEIEASQKNYSKAIDLLRYAVKVEDALTYQEPPDWFFSVRHSLGHWLIQAGQFEEAGNVYRKDLETYRENGWALMGLHNSLLSQNKPADAAEVKKRFDKAWQWADIKISSSRIY